MTEDQNRTVRLLGRSSSRGVYRTVLELPASKMEACADWVQRAREFSADAQFRFEETSGRTLFDKTYKFFRGLVR